MRVQIIFTVFFLFIIHSLLAQPQIEWFNIYGTAANDFGGEIIQARDGGFVVAGGQAIDENSDDWLIIKTDANGDVEWQKNFGTRFFERVKGLEQTADDGYVLTGGLSQSDSLLEEFTIVKLDKDGELLWQKFTGKFLPHVNDLALTADSGYILAGNSDGLGSDVRSDALFRKLNADGDLEWEKQYGGNLSDEIFSIQQTSDLGYIAVGCSNSTDGDLTSNNGDNDLWVLKMDAVGEIEWSKSFGGTNDEASRYVEQSADGGFVIAGYTSSGNGDVSENYGNLDVWIVKLDASGNLLWEKNYGGTSEDRAQSMQKVSTGGFVVSGFTRSRDVDVDSNNGIIDIWIFKIDEIGNLEWEKTFGGTGIDQSFAVRETADGGFVATGNTNSSNGDVPQNLGGFDLWVMKLMPFTVGVKESTVYEKINVFPNPNNGNFTIDAPIINGSVDVKMYDLKGVLIYSETNADITQTISIEHKASGQYLLEIIAEDKVYISKVILGK